VSHEDLNRLYTITRPFSGLIHSNHGFPKVDNDKWTAELYPVGQHIEALSIPDEMSVKQVGVKELALITHLLLVLLPTLDVLRVRGGLTLCSCQPSQATHGILHGLAAIHKVT